MTLPAETKVITAADLLAHPEWGRCELVRGEVISMSPTGMEHGKIAACILGVLRDYRRKMNAGQEFGTDAGVVLTTNPDTVRAPDAFFIVQNRLPQTIPATFCPIPPDLCAEVVSPDDRWSELMRKVQEYLDAGVKMVWVVVPNDRTVHVFESGQPARILGESGLLEGGNVLPGFSTPVRELFE